MTLTHETEAKEVRPTNSGADSEAFGGANKDINGLDPAAPSRPETLNAIVESVAATYLADLDPDSPPNPWKVEADLLKHTNGELRLEIQARIENVGAKADANNKNQLPLMKTLSPTLSVVTAADEAA